MSTFFDLSGKWKAELSDGSTYEITLPGTLDTNNIGFADKLSGKLYQDENYVENKALASQEVIATRLTRKHTYEGVAYFSRVWEGEGFPGKRIFLKAERARSLSLRIGEKNVPAISGSLSTPYVFEVTDLLRKGSVIELSSDNSYQNLPRENIIYSSAATDETQTNWNGIVGSLCLEVKEQTFIDSVRVYPGRLDGGDLWKIEISVCVDSTVDFEGTINIRIPSLEVTKAIDVKGTSGRSVFQTKTKVIVSKDMLWDEYEGRLVDLTADLNCGNRDTKEITFGIRSFYSKDGHLCLNGREIFLRSEANCAVFPETGHAPLDIPSWKKILSVYKGYGVNSVRFHSHCPPEAAFAAADEMGILLQPELSHWNPRDAFSSQLAEAYYEKEIREILREYADHPSFVMLAFGNELQADEKGLDTAHRLLKLCHELDSTRLYAFSSNAFYGEKGADEESDFFTAAWFKEYPMRATFDGMRGYLNSDYPASFHDYLETVKEIRREYAGPIFSFEVGQYEILPDFDELKDFCGVTVPKNLELIKRNVEKKGLLPGWKKKVEATGELALLAYREEIEAALRTEGYSGISLLGLQDFPGQGTALVGMLNSHLDPKPFSFADPSRFKSFFTDVLPLVYLKKYTYVEGEIIRAAVKVINYSKNDIQGELSYELSCNGDVLFSKRKLGAVFCRQGELTYVGDVEIGTESLKLEKNSMLELITDFEGFRNTYRIWIYKKNSQNPACPENVYETEILDGRAEEILDKGGIVFLCPESSKETFPNSIRSTFTTDFWSVGTFSSQEGSMGLLIDEVHPLFKDFPTSFHSDYQWFVPSSQRALILPDGVKSIVTVLDSYAYLRNMGLILEFNCKKGRVFISTIDLHEQNCPECKALLSSIYRYLASDDFRPSQNISYEKLNAWCP